MSLSTWLCSGSRASCFPSSFLGPAVFSFHSPAQPGVVTSELSRTADSHLLLLLLLSVVSQLCGGGVGGGGGHVFPSVWTHGGDVLCCGRALCSRHRAFPGKAWQWPARARAPPWVTTPRSGSPWPKWPWRTSTVTSSPSTRRERWGNGHTFHRHTRTLRWPWSCNCRLTHSHALIQGETEVIDTLITWYAHTNPHFPHFKCVGVSAGVVYVTFQLRQAHFLLWEVTSVCSSLSWLFFLFYFNHMMMMMIAI